MSTGSKNPEKIAEILKITILKAQGLHHHHPVELGSSFYLFSHLFSSRQVRTEVALSSRTMRNLRYRALIAEEIRLA